MSRGIPSKAVLILLEDGITITRIARELGITKQAVSHHLLGKSSEVNERLGGWLTTNLDSDKALEVMQAIWNAREARRATP